MRARAARLPEGLGTSTRIERPDAWRSAGLFRCGELKYSNTSMLQEPEQGSTRSRLHLPRHGCSGAHGNALDKTQLECLKGCRKGP